MRWIPILLILVLVPVLGAETVTKENYGEPDIKVNNKSYIPNETQLFFEPKEYVNVFYVIEPKTDEDAKIIDDRDYYISTGLENAKVKYRVVYGNGASVSREGFTISIPDADDLDGVDSIEINLTGYTPSIDERIGDLFALKIRVKDGGYILPDVVIYVMNESKLSIDFQNAKERCDNLTKFLAETEMAEVTTLKNYLDLARYNLTIAEEELDEGDYLGADERLKNAEFWLDKCEEEKVGIEAGNLYSLADEKIKDLGGILDKIEVYIEELEKKEILNTSSLVEYKARYKGIKDEFDGLTGDLASAIRYIDAGMYDYAKTKLESLLKEIGGVESESQNLLNELESLLTLPITPTTIPEKTGFPTIYLFVGATIVVALIISLIVKRQIRRRRWDELK